MSSDPAYAMVTEGLGKRYRLGATAGARSSYGSLRDDLVNFWHRRPKEVATDRYIWALRDISIAVQAGERVGIIGRNGAGKSTLLKMLSRITAPTEGRAEVRGRVGSLLEVGTGFHPELTGRDNIVLSGAILGMRHREIEQKMDDIVEFAGVSRFLDTPVKRFSSGMYLRLAFAVAAHLEPEILLVDEVLAVGDADFQKKCLGRMKEIGQSGRTVVFVSHSMPSVFRLCDRVILLDQGGVVVDGSPREVIRRYLESGLGSTAERHWDHPESAPGDDLVRLRSVAVLAPDGRPDEELDIRQPVDIVVEYWQLRDGDNLRPSVNLHLSNEDGVMLFVTNDFNNRCWAATPRKPGVVRVVCRIPGNFLAEARHFVQVAVSTYNPNHVHAIEAEAVTFQIVDRSSGDGVRGPYAGEWPGVGPTNARLDGRDRRIRRPARMTGPGIGGATTNGGNAMPGRSRLGQHFQVTTSEGLQDLDIYTEEGFQALAELWTRAGWERKLSYEVTWLGIPIIQLPEDIVMLQELVWRLAPDVVIESGVAHGGALLLYASILELQRRGRVIGIDVEIRKYNRLAIESHPLSDRITLLEGSSTSADVVRAGAIAGPPRRAGDGIAGLQPHARHT